jgi:uroporphyrin-3 C-methyltransferase
MALTLTQRADQVLQNLQDSSVLEIRKSLAEKIASLQQVPKVEVTGIYLTLAALDKMIDQLPLPASPLKAEQTQPIASNPEASWWERGLNQSWQALRKIVIVKNDLQNVLPVIMPEEKVFLFQNLHAQLASAMWGALHRNMPVYQASLARAVSWIQLYFDKDKPATQAMLKNISQLQAVNIEPPVITLAPTLKLFDDYFASK